MPHNVNTAFVISNLTTLLAFQVWPAQKQPNKIRARGTE